MDEFDKIREFSEDITKRKEPSLVNNSTTQPPVENDDDASLYNFKPDFADRLGAPAFDDLEEKPFSSMKLHFIAFGIVALSVNNVPIPHHLKDTKPLK